MSKKRSNKNPVYIPNQKVFEGNWGMPIEGTMREVNKENEIQKKLSLRNKK